MDQEYIEVEKNKHDKLCYNFFLLHFLCFIFICSNRAQMTMMTSILVKGKSHKSVALEHFGLP